MADRDPAENDAILFEATMLASNAELDAELTIAAAKLPVNPVEPAPEPAPVDNAAVAFEATMLASPTEAAAVEYEATMVVSASNPIVEETVISTRDPQANVTKEVTAPEPSVIAAPIAAATPVISALAGISEPESTFERRSAELPDQSTAPAREVQEVIEIKRRVIVPEPTRNVGGKDRAELWKQNKKRQQMQATRIVVMIVVGAAAIGAGIAVAVTMLVK